MAVTDQQNDSDTFAPVRTPASHHYAAELDGVRTDPDFLDVPDLGDRPLVIEGAGGLMVPLVDGILYLDIFERWRLLVVLCGSTALGTINHCLLSMEALRRRQISILGIAFVGEPNADTENAICEIGVVPWLGRLPMRSPLTSRGLKAAFKSAFSPATL